MLVLKSRKIYLLICLFLFSLAIPASAQTTEQFLTLSDLHFDPFLSCQKQPCPLIQKLESAPISQWQSIFSKEDHSVSAYGKDSNYELILSSLKAASTEGKAANLRFVLVLGDFLAHNYREKYLQYSDNKTQAGYLLFVQKTLAFLNAAFLQAFPQCDVYMVIGNNDSFGGDYNVIPEGAFFKDFSQQGASLIHHQANRQAFLQTFPTAGYFAVNAPSQPNLRLIFLNSVLFSIKVKGQRLEHAASAQLDWLHQELQQAAQRKRKVLIAMHIPTGIDVYMTLLSPFRIAEFWKTAYSKRFLTELQQASSEIIGVFQGHIHADSFQILSTAGKKPLPFTGTPSISPIFGNNPAFKIYSYSSPDLRLQNFTTYYQSLDHASEWKKEYNFMEVYDQGGEIIKGMLELGPKGALAEHYKTYYAVMSDSQPITKKNKWLPYYWCAIHELNSANYKECLYAVKGQQ